MRKIIVFSMITLDGVVQAPGGPQEDTSDGFLFGGWTAPYSDEIFRKAMIEELKPATYLLGRKTFEIWENYWPQHADFWPGINDGIKYVFSNSRDHSDWSHSRFVKTVAEIRELKASAGDDIHTWGSTRLVQLLLKANLVDELRLKIYPVILGKGKKIFGNESAPASLILSDSIITSKGVILANYRRDGPIVTGSVGI